MKRFSVLLMMSLVLGLSAVAGAQNPCNPCNPCGGKAMNACTPKQAVNPCYAKMGTVFYIADPMNRNVVTFSSEAPLEDIVGTTNQISGYVVFNPDEPKKGVYGEIMVPVASLNTGIPLRNEHLRSPMWLNADANPYIKLHVNKLKNVKNVKSSNEFRTYELTVAGEFTLNGKSREMTFPVTVTHLTESKQTQQRLPGNLLATRSEFAVALADFGVKGFEGVVGNKVSETIRVSVSFTATNQNPSMAAATNPCNPCNPCHGKKAKNACNPCGK